MLLTLADFVFNDGHIGVGMLLKPLAGTGQTLLKAALGKIIYRTDFQPSWGVWWRTMLTVSANRCRPTHNSPSNGTDGKFSVN